MSALALLPQLSEQIRALDGAVPERPKPLPLGLSGALSAICPKEAGLDGVLPDGGLPRGAIVEVAAARALGRSTSVALAACAAAQADARLRSGDPSTVGAWCAFVDPWSTLHAPAVVASGVDPMRLLVVRPPMDALARSVLRIAQSRAFSMIAVDLAGVPGVEVHAKEGTAAAVRLDRWVNVVRRLALAIEKTDSTVLLLTDAAAPRSMPLPVALRLELECTREKDWVARVAKDRHGRVGPRVVVGGGRAA
jgi:RecA/RadA recombinase